MVSDAEIEAYIDAMPSEMKQDIAETFAMNDKLLDLLEGFCKSELGLCKELKRMGDTGPSATMAREACRQNLLVIARFMKAHGAGVQGGGHHGPH